MRFIPLFFTVFLFGCQDSTLLPIEKTRELIVLTRIGVTTYSVDSLQGASGFEHDLVQDLARDLGMKIRMVAAASDADLLRRLKRGEAHLAAAWMTPIEDDDAGIRNSTPYFESRDVLVTHEASLPINRLDQLAGRTIHVVPGSRQEKALNAIRSSLPDLMVIPVLRSNELDLMEGVAAQRFEATLVSNAAFDIGNNFYPELQKSLEVGTSQPIVWLFAPGVDPKMVEKSNDFLARMQQSKALNRLKDRYFGHVNRLTSIDTASFIERMQTILPRFRPHFQEAQARTGIDWRLLAALAYQESAWEPLATSPTGVRGLMMLTGETADRLRVSNRLDPVESIRAGAQYLADLRDALPSGIREQDRLWLALAAYNLGMGHLNAARQIARSLGADPDSWYEMKKVLPLLAKPQYYSRLKSGRGRGGEAVIMTENIRVYADILKRHERPFNPMKPKTGKLIWRSYPARPDTD